MKLNVAVQMDPIERINIRGDSTFALLLEAQKRGHGLSYYTPDKLSLRGEEVVAPVRGLTVRDEVGDHFKLGEPRREPLAQYDVGASYMGGNGVKASDVDGAMWFQRAANQGMAYAQFNLGLLHASGTGVDKDSIEALKWLDLALVGLPPGGARSDVSRAIADVAQKMTTEEIAEARSRARRFRPKAERP